MYEMVQNRRVLVGRDSVSQLGALLRWYRVKRPFVLVYNAQASFVTVLLEQLRKADVLPTIFDEVTGEPDLKIVERGTQRYRESGCDGVVAVGGGSVIDAAKAISLLSANEGSIESYQLEGRPFERPGPPFVVVPTTAGTGAEATKVSVLYNNHGGFKKSVYDVSMIADAVILDPEATKDLPPAIVASTGIDALTHAIESYVSRNATPITEMYSLAAAEIIRKNLPVAYREPQNEKAREQMLLGSYLAGCSLTASIGLAHIVGQPLGAMLHIPHGEACSIFLAECMRQNLSHAEGKYAILAKVMGVDTAGMSAPAAAEAAIETVECLIAEVHAPDKLYPYLESSELDMEAALENIQKGSGHIATNPRPVDRTVLRAMIENSLRR